MLIRSVCSSGFNEFLVKKIIEIISRTLQKIRNIPTKKTEYSMRQNNLISAFL